MTRNQKQRLTENEAVFRRWNESVKHVDDDTSSDFICECSDENCGQMIIMENRDYGRIHEQRDHFTVVPGHEVLSVEDVVREHSDYTVVQKKVTPSETNPTLSKTDVDNT